MTSHLHLRIIDNPLVENKTWRTATLERMVAILIRDQTFNLEADAIRSLRAHFDMVDIIMCIDDARQAAMQDIVARGDGEAVTRRYAKARVTPEAPWLRIVDRASGLEFRNVIEVDADDGWLERVVVDAEGKFVSEGDKVKTERLEGLSLRIDIDRGTKGHYRGETYVEPTHDWQEWNPADIVAREMSRG